MNLDLCMPWVCRRLAFHEGVKLRPYRDSVGKLTIGVGRNLDDNPLTPEERKACGDIYQGITKNAAYMLLRNDVTRCEEELRKNIPFYLKLDVERQYALLDICFQQGLQGLLKYKKMLKHLENKEYHGAAFECLNSNYHKQTPSRCERIAKLIKIGEWER